MNEWMNNSPRGQSSLLGAKFTPAGNFTPKGKLMLLKTGLRVATCKYCELQQTPTYILHTSIFGNCGIAQTNDALDCYPVFCDQSSQKII
jgi:hypothetical protein